MMCVVAHPDDECYAFGGALGLAFGLVVVRSAEGRLELVGEVSATTMRGDAPHVPECTPETIRASGRAALFQ